jgi:DNA-binding MarR family transcriptional regulator
VPVSSVPASSAPALAGDLFLACGRLSRAAARLNRAGDSAAGWRAMVILDESGPLRISEFATLDRCSQPTATTMIKKLEEAGYAERTADPEDGRAWLVRLTPSGRHRLATMRSDTAQMLAERLRDQQDVTETEIEAALRVLTRVTEMINKKGDVQ